MSNFKFPYFSRDIGEFWRRWHISLSTWFRDYLYIPLGGSKGGEWLSIRNIFIIFIVSGFWHGANWTFIMWGLIHAVLYIPLFLSGKNRQYTLTVVAEDRWFPTIKELFQMGITFFSTMIAWVFFRSENISESYFYLQRIILERSFPKDNRGGAILIIIFILLEWNFRKNERNPINFKIKYIRWLVYTLLFYSIFAFFRFFEYDQFIYFEF